MKIQVIGVGNDSTMKSKLDNYDMSITNGLSNEVIFPIRNYHTVGTSDVIPILKTENYSDFNEKKHKQTCIKNRKERNRKKKHKR